MNANRREALKFAADHLRRAIKLIDRVATEESAAIDATPDSLVSDESADTLDMIETLRDALTSAIDDAADILPA